MSDYTDWKSHQDPDWRPKVPPTPQNTPDEIDDFLHLVADGWGIEFFDLGVEDKHSELLDLVERCEADIRQELAALITAARIEETTKMRSTAVAIGDATYYRKAVPIETFDARLAELATLTNDKIEGEHGGLERLSDEK